MLRCMYFDRTNRPRRVALVACLLSLVSLSAQAQNRMPPIPDEELTEAQKEAVEEFRAAAANREVRGPWSFGARSYSTGCGA